MANDIRQVDCLGIAGTFGQGLVLQLDLEVDPSPGWRLQCTADRY